MGSSVPLISERKGTDPHWKHLRCTHFASWRGSRDVIASLACVRLTGWPVAWNWRRAVLSADAGPVVKLLTWSTVTSRNFQTDVNGIVLLTRFIRYWHWSDESCLLFTRYSGYILQVRWINLKASTLCLKKGYHPTTNDNFNNSCPIPVMFGTNIAE